jgi:hypothetical protein
MVEQTECSETSAYKIQKPVNYPEENIEHTEQGESLKSRTLLLLQLSCAAENTSAWRWQNNAYY